MTRFPIDESDQIFSFRQVAAIQAILANPKAVRRLRRWWLRPLFWFCRFSVELPDGPVVLSPLMKAALLDQLKESKR